MDFESTQLRKDVDALRAELETLRSDLRQLQNAVAALTHATTEAFDNCHAAQRAYTDRAVGERPAPGSTERGLQEFVSGNVDPDADPFEAVAASIAFLCNELDQVRR